MTEYLHGLLDPQLFSNIISFRIKCRKVEKKHMDERRERDYTLDYLRALGTALVIFAHITTPTGILEIRTFDVTMLVFVSGASYALSAKEKQILHTKEYFEYIFNRFKRLIVPTWIFLTLYFILFHLLNLCGVTDVYFTLKDYMGSYLLVSGIGFVWVIRVYFLMAIIAPILLTAIRKMKKPTFYMSLILAAGLQSILVKTLKIENGALWKMVELIVPYMLGYGIVYALGMKYALGKKNVVKKFIVFAMIFFGYAIVMRFPSINALKYPPHIYYLAYGLFMTYLIIYVVNACGGGGKENENNSIRF